MKVVVISALISINLLLQGGKVHSFHPNQARKFIPTELKSSVPMSEWYKLDTEHAHDCADNFGMCELSDLEALRMALHTERIQHHASGLMFDPVQELDIRLLEEDLSLQLCLLKGKMDDCLPYSLSTPDPYNGSASFKRLIKQAGDLFLVPDVVDVSSLCLAVFIIVLVPSIFQGGIA